jgi:hypothetical protein
MSFDYDRTAQNRQHGYGDHAGSWRANPRVDFGHTVRRWVDWAKSRPSESWVFFAAGLVLGGIVM